MIFTIPEIQYITRDDEKYSHVEQVKLMFEYGIQWVQLRIKDTSQDEVLEQAKEAMAYAKKYGAILTINDSIEATKEADAYGVHLGLKDMPIDKAREELGDRYIIGGTANTLEDIKLQVKLGADYIGLGPFRYTETKKNLSPVIGIEGYQQIIAEMKQLNITIPIIAVGGITMDDVEDILNTGVDGVAISKALLDEYRLSLSQERIVNK